jgi:lysophospholipase L1-like esterase
VRVRYALGCFAVAAGLLVVVPSPARGQAAQTHPYTVAAMGDSLTDLKSPGGGKYLTYLAERCPKSRFDCYGKGGQMVNQMRGRFARDVLNTPPTPDKPRYTHVIVFGGVNDVCSDETAHRTNDKLTADLRAMYDLAQQAGVHVVAITIAPWGGFKKYYNPRRAASTRKVNDWIKTQVQQGSVDTVLESGPVLSCGDPERLCKPYAQPDGLHLNAQGHRKLADALFEQAFKDCE